MKCKMVIEQMGTSSHPDYPRETIPVGYIRDAPDAYKLVQAGSAIPADEECRVACGMTKAEMDLRQRHYAACDAGIAEEDREAFFSGLMTGYNADLSWKRGPNWVDEEDEDDEWAVYEQPEEYHLVEEELPNG